MKTRTTRPTMRTQKLQSKWYAALGVVLALGGLYAVRVSRSSAALAPAKPAAARVGDGARDAGSQLQKRFMYGLVAGKAYNYEIEQATHVVRSGQPYAQATGKGTLQANVVHADPAHIDLILSVKYAGAASTAGALAQALGNSAAVTPMDVSGSAHVRIARNGAVEALSFLPNREQETSRRIMTSVIGAWLYTLPKVNGKGPYFAQASDVSGEFTSEYRVDGDFTSPLSLDMRKLSYSNASALTEVTSSQHHLKWDLLGGYLLHADSEDRFNKGGALLHISSTETSKVDFDGITDSALTQTDLARYSEQSAMYVAPHARKSGGPAVGEGKTESWAELHTELRNLPSDPESEKPLDVFGTLANSLMQHPEMLPQVLAEARTQSSSSTQFKMLIGAVGNLGTPDAQSGLIDLYENTDHDGKNLVIKAQTMMESEATPATRKMLLDTYDHPTAPDLQNGAGLALGNSLRNGSSQDDSVSATRERVRRMWTEATSLNEKEYALSVIGNSGDPSFIDLLLPEIQNSDSLFRAQAVSALRFMNDDRSAAVLFQVVGLNDQPALQSAALGALYYHGWSPDFFEPLSRCFTQPSTPEIRIDCAKVILQQPQEQQRMRALLQQVRASGPLDATLAAFVEQQLST